MEQSSNEPVILSPRKADFVRGIMEGKSQREAARSVGILGSSASKLMADENVRLALKEAAIAAGNTPDALADTLRRAREAMRTELDREGNVVELGPDWRSRLQGTDITIKMLGGYPKPGADIAVSGQNVLVIRADQGLASSDPFESDADESGMA